MDPLQLARQRSLMVDITNQLDKFANVPGAGSKGSDMALPSQDPRFKITVNGEYALEHQEVQHAELDVIRIIQSRHNPTVKEIGERLPGMSENNIKSVIMSLYKHNWVTRC